MNEKNTRSFECVDTMDAEAQAIVIIPQVLQDLTAKRSIAVLEYLIGRYLIADTFGN